MTTDDRRRVPATGPWGDVLGSSRAVAAGGFVFVGGCTTLQDGAVTHEGAPYLQARDAFRVGLEALAEYGLTAADVVRTRIYLTHARDLDDVGRAHRELFGEHRPVASLLVVSGFVDPRILVEVELEAVLGDQPGEGTP